MSTVKQIAITVVTVSAVVALIFRTPLRPIVTGIK